MTIAAARGMTRGITSDNYTLSILPFSNLSIVEITTVHLKNERVYLLETFSPIKKEKKENDIEISSSQSTLKKTSSW